MSEHQISANDRRFSSFLSEHPEHAHTLGEWYRREIMKPWNVSTMIDTLSNLGALEHADIEDDFRKLVSPRCSADLTFEEVSVRAYRDPESLLYGFECPVEDQQSGSWSFDCFSNPYDASRNEELDDWFAFESGSAPSGAEQSTTVTATTRIVRADGWIVGFCGSGEEADEFAEEFLSDPDHADTEPFCFYLLTGDRGADGDLRDIGERVVDLGDGPIWGRETFGQLISADHCVQLAGVRRALYAFHRHGWSSDQENEQQAADALLVHFGGSVPETFS